MSEFVKPLKTRCKGICTRYRVSRKNTPPYAKRYSFSKRCTICEEYIGINHNKCPCCNNPHLRTKSKVAKKKIKAPQI